MRSISDLVDMGLEVSTADGAASGGALAVLGAVVAGASAVGLVFAVPQPHFKVLVSDAAPTPVLLANRSSHSQPNRQR